MRSAFVVRVVSSGGRRRGIRERRYTMNDACSPTRAARNQTDAASGVRQSNPDSRSRRPPPAARHPDSIVMTKPD
jgi:hypothetical protein